MEKLFDLANDYADEMIDSADFQRLLSLKEQINKDLSKKIVAFKTMEAKYLEAKNYGNHHPNLLEYQKEFSRLKSELYSEALVKEYFELEKSIQTKLDEDINSLKKSISNKFIIKKSYYL